MGSFISILLGLILGAAIVVGGTWVVVWNVNDVITYGANFWNIFWLLLVGMFLFGGSAKAAS